jgi:AcrR family transcriptional regulator
MDAGMRRFERSGVRAARIDDICRDTGIAKGSFYAFFPSKEELFMAIAAEREVLHRSDMLAFIDSAAGPVAKRAARFFDLILGKIETDPVLNLVVGNDEIAYLMRKLGPDRVAALEQDDRAFVREASRRWKKAMDVTLRPADLLSLMTIMLSLAVQRHRMTQDRYRPAVALLREMFVAQLTKART